MKNSVYAAVVVLGLTGGAYAGVDGEGARAGGSFDLPRVNAAELRAAAPADSGAIKPERIPSGEQPGSKKIKFDFVSKAERREYIAQASLWVPEDSLNTGAIDFKKSPFAKPWYLPEELVTCKYLPMAAAYEGGKPNGATPKFKCEDPKGRKLKVKYGTEDGEVYSEVAATWIMTGIGAYADKMYPVRLNCPDCPSDPFENEQDRGSWASGTKVAIEDKTGERIEVRANSGLGFDEYYTIEDRVGAEALIGLAHFLKNGDNKAANQAIGCLEKDTVKDPATGKAKCLKPIVLLQDTGMAFGAPGVFSFGKGKMNYDAWTAEPVWSDPAICRLDLKTHITCSSLPRVDFSGRDLHQIGEKARQMLVRRLSLLSRGQLIDIFTAARAPERAPRHSAEEWADLFLSKVEKLRNPAGRENSGKFSCPYTVVPRNSAVLDGFSNDESLAYPDGTPYRPFGH